jgi:hypothetical protein
MATDLSQFPVPNNRFDVAQRNAADLDKIINESASVSTRTGKVVQSLEQALASISAITDRGAWTTATSYQVKDLVVDSGIFYIAVIAHTSGATFAGDIANWRVFQGVTVNQGDNRYGPIFATEAAMTSVNPVSIDGVVVDVTAGMAIHRQGRLAAGDDGAADYLVVAGDSSDGKTRLLMDSGTTAVLQTGAAIHSEQAGGTPAIIFVATTGSDSNTGFDSASPLLTPAAAAAALSGLGAYLTGQWEVSFAAGTYVGGFELDSQTQSDFPIDIFGPVVGHPNVPTAIFDMTTDASGTGIASAVQSRVRSTDIKVINATTGSGAECNAAQLSLTNFHTANCLRGCVNLHGGFVSVRGGDWDGSSLANSVGYQSFYSSTHDFIQATNDAATDALVIHDFDRGMLINEGVQGHLDNVNILDCAGSGLNIKRGAGAVNTKTMKIDGCGVGVLAENNAWYDNGISFGSISPNTIDIKTVGDSPELVRRTQTREFFGPELPAFNVAAHTGTVTKTTIHSFDTFPKEFMGQIGHSFWAELELVLTNSSAVDPIVEIALGTTPLAAIPIASAETGALIHIRGVFLTASGASNVVSNIGFTGRLGTTDYVPGVDTINMVSADRQLNLRVTLGGTSDSVTVRLGTYGTTVGG